MKPGLTTKPGLGIDFGGVIMPLTDRTRGPDTQFSGDFLHTPPNPGAVEEIRTLAGTFDGNVWIVSKAGPRMQSLTLDWLRHQDFFRRTGMDETHIRFCRERTDKEPICRDLGITHFVDDRVHIMQILQGTVANLYLFGDKEGNRSAREWITLVDDWPEAAEAILGDLAKLKC